MLDPEPMESSAFARRPECRINQKSCQKHASDLVPRGVFQSSSQKYILHFAKETLRLADLAKVAEFAPAVERLSHLTAGQAYLFLDALDPCAALLAHLDLLTGRTGEPEERLVVLLPASSRA